MARRKLRAWRTDTDEWRQLAGAGHLYAVVESCREPSVRDKAEELGPARAVSLFEGTYEAQYERAAPFFFLVDPELFDWIKDSFWDTSWGILIWARTAPLTLLAHLRSFLRVKNVRQEQCLFRFYDPYILSAFLRSCNDAELVQFFGPAQGFGANHAENLTLFRISPLPK